MFRPEVDAPASPSVSDFISSRGYPFVPDGEPRQLAARLLERTLLRLGRAGLVVERRLAPGLSRLRGRRLYRLLGYVRLADYLTERLGMSLRRCQSILRLERALAGLPRMAQALDAGEVSVSRLEVAAGAATTETEAVWLERAKRLPLADLREIARRGSASPAVSSSLAASSLVDSAAGAATPDRPMAPAPPMRPDLPIEQDEPGRLISFAAPASVVAVWHWTLDLIRRVAGQQEPAWRCAEYLAAEFLSGVPDTAGDPASGRPRTPDPAAPNADALLQAHDWPARAQAAAAAGADPSVSSPHFPVHSPGSPVPVPDFSAHTPDSPARAPDFTAHSPNFPARAPDLPARDAPGMAVWIEAVAAVREALASIGASADPEAILSGRPAAGGSSQQEAADAEPEPESELDAWELDARLRRLVRLRQSLAWRQGHLLATFASLRLHRELGFDTFDDWIAERLAMSTRRARYLVSLSRRLRDLPLLSDAYGRGLVSWCQARLLVRVVRPATQSRWIRYARQVTVRRLEDVVVECEVSSADASSSPAHIGASRPAAPDPLPPTDPIYPADPLAPADPISVAVSQLPAGPSSQTDLSSPAGSPPADSAPPAGSVRHTSAPSSAPHVASSNARDRLPTRRISFWCPLEVAALWDSALRACRAAAGAHLEDWECFLLLARSMRDTWENQEDPHWRRRYRIFERDGWRCKAPGCTSRSGLNEHHIIFRSRQGGDDAANLVTLCVGHHQQGLHEGRIRCFGTAPDGLWWDLGVKPGGEALVRYFGDRMVRRRPFVPVVSLRPAAMALPRRPAAVTAGAG